MVKNYNWRSSAEKPVNEYNQGGHTKSVLVEVITNQKTRMFASFYSYPVEGGLYCCWITDEGGEIFAKIVCWRYIDDLPKEFFK